MKSHQNRQRRSKHGYKHHLSTPPPDKQHLHQSLVRVYRQPGLFGLLDDNLGFQLNHSQFVHVAHDEVHSWEREEQQVDAEEGWHVERKVPLVGHGHCEFLCFFEVGNVA